MIPALDDVDAVIFDLGGVLLNLDYDRTVRALSALGANDARELYSRTKQIDLFDRFERGEVSSPDFRRELKAHLGTNAPDAALDAAWNALLLDVPDETVALLKRLKKTRRTFLLSNTNEIHLSGFLRDFAQRHGSRHGEFDALFERAHYSHLMGMRKPEARIFEHLVGEHSLERKRTLFIDDNEHNVRAAREVGLLAHPVDPTPGSGPGQVVDFFRDV